MDEINPETVLEGQGVTVDARELKGTVKVLSPSQFSAILARRIEEARAETIRRSIGPGDIPKMLDSYLRENVNLKARNESQSVKIGEYEKKIAALEEKLSMLGGSGASPGPAGEKYMDFDPAPARAAIDRLSSLLAETESGLNEVGNMEESWVFIEKIASIRTDMNRIMDEAAQAESAMESLASEPPPPALYLAEAVLAMKSLEREAGALEKTVTLVRSLLGLE